MKRNGFTLIELLAVIVILAIIALIAIPIVLNIVDDAIEKSEERSVELYASAVKNAIAAYRLNNTVAPENFSDLTIEYDGDVQCDIQKLYPDKTIYLGECTVNDGEKEYSYGKLKVTQPTRYYAWDLNGTVGSTDAPAESERLIVAPTGKNFYLGYEVEAGKVSAAYVCFKTEENGTEYCLKSEQQEEKKAATYEANKTVLEEAFGASACSFVGGNYSCRADGLNADANLYGEVDAYFDVAHCFVTHVDGFGCNE